MTNPRGRCLIINNSVFDDPPPGEQKHPTRTGSGVDVLNLKIVLEDLNFQVNELSNLKREVIVTIYAS